MKKQSILVHEDEDPFGPGVDLMVALVAFLLFVITGVAVLYKQSAAEASKQRAVIGDREARIRDLERENRALKLRGAHPPRLEFPPNILIKASHGFEFASGKAVLQPNLAQFIDGKLVSTFHEYAEEYGVDTIVVIGHTDGQRVGGQRSNLDEFGNTGDGKSLRANDLTAASNVDLGMMRALAVVEELRKLQQEGKLRGVDPRTGFRAYSAGPFLATDGSWTTPGQGSDEERRRIEIRFLNHAKDLKHTIDP